MEKESGTHFQNEMMVKNEMEESEINNNSSENADLEIFRKHIPERLQSGYVIHAFLFCALNGFGATIELDRYMIESIQITSYWDLKFYCLFIIKRILKKKQGVTSLSDWDKSLRQRWFNGWVQKERFFVKPKTGRELVTSQLVFDHKRLSDTQRKKFLSLANRWIEESNATFS
eukprot:TRINITY_DN1932_c0_g1_i2.p1 TRINITY_DN1932_c0_g1~~TRINITY_DN1932_c0_g1_i2.p1  ORF type:complete len:173 (+),score=13.15 TRINITY_DN1932_c0_g1_i2:458-976(+)